MTDKKRWTDGLDEHVYARLGNCCSRKSDILPLAQAKWNSMRDDPEYTKENALIEILDLLDCNSQFFDLSKAEYDGIIFNIL